MDLKRLALIILIAMIAAILLIYRSRQGPKDLNVEPHAAREIEKAKRR